MYVPTSSVDGSVNVWALVSRRLFDAKATVRLAALQLLEAMCLSSALSPSEAAALLDNARVLKRATDESPAVRKQVVSTLTALFDAFSTGDRTHAAVGLWMSGVLPLARDPEATVVDKVRD